MSARKSAELVPLMVRMREGLRRRLATEAKANLQSMNAEITERLEQSFAKDYVRDRDTKILDLLIGQERSTDGKTIRYVARILSEYFEHEHGEWTFHRDKREKMAEKMGRTVASIIKQMHNTEIVLDDEDLP